MNRSPPPAVSESRSSQLSLALRERRLWLFQITNSFLAFAGSALASDAHISPNWGARRVTWDLLTFAGFLGLGLAGGAAASFLLAIGPRRPNETSDRSGNPGLGIVVLAGWLGSIVIVALVAAALVSVSRYLFLPQHLGTEFKHLKRNRLANGNSVWIDASGHGCKLFEQGYQ